MPEPENYRLHHLYALSDCVLNKGFSIRMFRDLDQRAGTRFYRDLSTGKVWPDYINWFGLWDPLSDLFAEVDFDLSQESFLGRQELIGSKHNVQQLPPFTPSSDPALRREFGLDRHDKAWVYGIRFAELKPELKRARWVDIQTGHLHHLAARHLTYALASSRGTATIPLAGFCLAEFFRIEIETKLILARQRSCWQPREQSRFEMPRLEALLGTLASQAEFEDSAGFLEWSFNMLLSERLVHELDELFGNIHRLIIRIHRRHWLDKAQLADALADAHAYCDLMLGADLLTGHSRLTVKG